MNKFSLDKHPKITSGFTTPEHYFDNLSDTIFEKMNQREVKKGSAFTLKRITYAAAAVLLLTLSIPFLTNNSATSLEQIDTNSLENYITYQTNVSQYDLINLMDSKDIESIDVDLALEDQSVEDILTNNPNFENYIID